MNETVIKLTDVWKIFGKRADEAIAAVRSEGIGKPEVLELMASQNEPQTFLLDNCKSR